MQPKLLLVDEDRKVDWKLDEKTKEVGRRGIQAAREALRRSEQQRETAA